MKRALFWFRRDLRITDNTALSAAAARAAEVVPVYVISSWKAHHRWTGPHRQEFLCGCLISLAQNLESIGGRLILRQGRAEEELEKLAMETRAEAIFFNRDPDPFGRKVEAQIKVMAKRLGLEVADFKDVCLHERDEVLTGESTPFRMFTPYAKAWMKGTKIQPMGRLRNLKTPPGIPSLDIPEIFATWGISHVGGIVEPGEKAARERMKKFLGQGLAGYGSGRDIPAAEATSRLSQDLRYGLFSIRELFARGKSTVEKLPAKTRGSGEKFLTELIWREFYMQILWFYPSVLEKEFNPKYHGLKWPGDPGHFSLWREGLTGFPLVDAAMRELNSTGFMHNRARMITAMFLTKDLHLDWRLGERYFMQKLTDGEIASNNGGWQWSAGTGADAAPYFRIQNPWTQTARYDGTGEYIKRWVPELRDLAPGKFSSPPPHGESLARDYPAPIVDHAESREKTLNLFKSHRGSNG